MSIKKSGMISIVGRPNVGKSTLTNALVGEKVAIVSNKPQTTRNRICAILNRGESQFVFLDTPGLHKARTRLGWLSCRHSAIKVSAVILAIGIFSFCFSYLIILTHSAQKYKARGYLFLIFTQISFFFL